MLVFVKSNYRWLHLATDKENKEINQWVELLSLQPFQSQTDRLAKFLFTSPLFMLSNSKTFSQGLAVENILCNLWTVFTVTGQHVFHPYLKPSKNQVHANLNTSLTWFTDIFSTIASSPTTHPQTCRCISLSLFSFCSQRLVRKIWSVPQVTPPNNSNEANIFYI